jgi:hypothetical protein
MADHLISVALDPCSTITGFACALGAEWRQLQSPKAERLTVDTTGGPRFLLNSYAKDSFLNVKFRAYISSVLVHTSKGLDRVI